LFDPRREHSSVPTAKWHSRCAEGLSRLAASSRPPAGLGLDWPEHSGILDRIGAGGAHHVIGNFKPVVLDEIHAAADTPNSAKARAAFISEQAARIAARTGMSEQEASLVVARQCDGTLLPNVVLPFDDEELSGRTVADVLADPERFEGATLADPLEGVDYGICKARIMRRADGTMWVHSFAHGRTTYELRLDARAVRSVERADPENRPFKHLDPVNWTELHRGAILQAFYTILLGNPMLAKPADAPAQTRFKMWWRIVGAAVEHAARLAGHPFDFREAFLAMEEDDEEATSLAHALDLMAKQWPTTFKAVEVA
jgi:hypothetical protein